MNDKGVIISIQPHWCELIAEGKKLVEVRKTFPSAYAKPFPTAPSGFDKFKSFIYCTQKGKSYLSQGKVIGEFTCSGIETYGYNENGYGLKDEKKLLELSCLTAEELYHYLQGKKAYGWGVSDLVMYDKPRELSEFGLERPPQSWCYVV